MLRSEDIRRIRLSAANSRKVWRILATLALVLGLPAAESGAQSLEWEARWDGGLVDSSATPLDVVVGSNGNFHATGAIRNGGSQDLLTVTWSDSGNLLWYRVKDGDRGSNDVAAAIGTDDDGRVAVAGTSGGQNFDQLLTVAYDANGNELWSRTHWNAAYRWNRARGLAFGADGRIVVLAEISNGTLKKALLLSYDSTGDLLWERERDLGPSFGGLAIGPDGVIAVAGRSNDIGFDDFLTVAFDATGTELWSRTRDGVEGRDDYATSLSTSSNGHFIATGVSQTADLGLDTMTVAYDVEGIELWAATMSGPGDQSPVVIEIDSNGNVLVAGTTRVGSESHAFVVSYDLAGKARWTTIRGDADGENSSARDLTVSAGGDVLVTATHYGVPLNDYRVLTMRLDSETGEEVWIRIKPPAPNSREEALALASSSSGSLFVLGLSVMEVWTDFLAVAYDAGGNILWTRTEPMIPSADVPGSFSGGFGRTAIATGYEGRVYVTGSSFNGVARDFVTVAYDASGLLIWEARKSNPNHFSALARAIAVDPVYGNVYVTGTTSGPGGIDYLTVAYDRTGAEIWSRTKQGVDQGSHSACCIAVNAEGLVIVAGTSGTQSEPNILIVAYERLGNEIWSDEWGPSPGSADFGYSLAVGSTGLVFVGGYTVDLRSDALTVAYDASGNRIWSAVRDGGTDGADYVFALAPAPGGGVVAAGSSDTDGNTSLFTIAYGADGVERWAATEDGARGGLDAGTAVAVDSAGRTTVTGYSFAPDLLDPDFMTVSYDATGGLLWSRERGGGAGGDDFASSLTIDSQGTIFVTGASDNGANRDFLTVAYSAGGYELFEHRYDAGGEDEAYLAVGGSAGSVFIGGVSDGAEDDFLILKILDETRQFADGFDSGDTSAWTAAEP